MSTYADYQARVLADGAVSYWPLTETSGTTAADLKGARPGTIANGGAGVTLGAPGVTAGTTAMAFDGTGRIDAAALPPLQAGFSQEVWWWTPVALIGGARITALSRDEFASVFTKLQIALASLYIAFYAGAASVVTLGAAAVAAWQHVVVTYDGTTLRLYANGGLIGTSPATLGPDAGNPATALGGELQTPANGWVGRLQDIAVYPAALTPAQITAHYDLRLAAGGGGARPPIPWGVFAHRRFP